MNNNSPSNLIDGVGLRPADDTQQSSAVKKTPLGNVHYQNGSFLASHQEPVKIPRNKKLTPENPSNLPSRLPFCNNAPNEHIVNARRRFELELGKGRGYSVEKYTDYLKPLQASQPPQENPTKRTRLKESSKTRVPVGTSSNLTPSGKLTKGGPSLPNHLGKNDNSIRATDFPRVSAEIPQNIVSKSTVEQRMSDRFIQLQKFLKQCDESRHTDYSVKLLRLSPTDLSRHAADLERRALHLKVEEGKELQRMNSLNIPTKSASEYPMQATQWSRK